MPQTMSPAAEQLNKTPTLMPLEESLLRQGNRLPLQTLEDDATLKALQQQGIARYHQLGFPARRLEAWKYAPIQLLGKQTVSVPALPGPLDAALLKEADHLITLEGPRLAFIDGYYSLRNSKPMPLEGATITDLRSAYNTHPECVLKALHHWHSTTDDAFDALNTALHTNGLCMNVQDGMALEQPVHLACFSGHQAHPASVFQHHAVMVGKNAKATIFVQILGLPSVDAARLLHQAMQLHIEEGATLDVVVLHDDALVKGWQLLSVQGEIAARATLNLTTIGVGMGAVRHNIQLNLNAEGAHVNHRVLNVLQQAGQAYVHSVINHAAPACSSDQLAKSILLDNAVVDFDGTIVVADDAQLTDAAQLSKTLLLSDTARTYARPQLRIDADDVKCAHGATVGQLNDEELFYLAARGLPKEAAQCLLTFGFAEDALDLVQHPAVARYVNHQILAALGQSENPLACELECSTCKTPEK